MFQASVDGELYDVERWGNFYKPYGVDVPKTQSTTPAAQPTPTVTTEPVAQVSAPAPAVAETTTPVVETPAPAPVQEQASSEKPSADDILNMIRKRS